ncbi:phage portal protein BeeE [Curtobacterium sp. PhB42]|uniref:phage portal protein n=1 Tax=unclassified Curtobacterium TaxID=257496 RepID=UPI0010638393|nr:MULTISPECIES: phage portal protein [unclassified Curtobacterium]TDW50992.1 phage portal protein BeeE [Curtobacterium sp. PhB42]TDW56162.1 phage portal protein BeeE [Curtobacterium sp. PhB190]
MGFLDWLGLSTRQSDAFAAARATSIGVLSQYADSSSIKPLVISESLGIEIDSVPMDRGIAMSIPSVSKGQHLLTSMIARFPLRALDENGAIPDQPTWLYRTNGDVSPYARMVATIDDLIFHGRSLWLTSRGAAGQILEAEWVPIHLWRLQDGQFYIEGRKEPLDRTEMILHTVPLWDGLLSVAASNLRGARDVERAWQGRARNPIPVMVLKETQDNDLEQDEIDEYVEAWSTARKSENGAVGYLPRSLEMEVHGEVSADLMEEGRNAVKSDVGNFLNIPTSLLDGTVSQASLTYTTKEGDRNLFFDLSLPFWTDPIAQRLSQDDCVPRGQRVRFDMYDLYTPTPSATGPLEED